MGNLLQSALVHYIWQIVFIIIAFEFITGKLLENMINGFGI